jgi:hypothetical protein
VRGRSKCCRKESRRLFWGLRACRGRRSERPGPIREVHEKDCVLRVCACASRKRELSGPRAKGVVTCGQVIETLSRRRRYYNKIITHLNERYENSRAWMLLTGQRTFNLAFMSGVEHMRNCCHTDKHVHLPISVA